MGRLLLLYPGCKFKISYVLKAKNKAPSKRLSYYKYDPKKGALVLL